MVEEKFEVRLSLSILFSNLLEMVQGRKEEEKRYSQGSSGGNEIQVNPLYSSTDTNLVNSSTEYPG